MGYFCESLKTRWVNCLRQTEIHVSDQYYLTGAFEAEAVIGKLKS